MVKEKDAIPITFSDFSGMRMQINPPKPDPSSVYFAQDLIPADAVNRGPYIRRPSDQPTTVKAAAATTVQHLGVFKNRNSFVGVAVVDGEIYTVSGTTWTRVVTTANLTAATGTITLSSSARVFAVTFNNTYVFNDGVNQPFSWDGTSGASGLTKLTNAPTKCYGKPAVYYGKLFFIKDVAGSNADRSKIVWSEEYAANTGYEASGYTNVWQLEQSGSGALFALVGTNTGLYYFRRDAIGVIRGAVTPAFTTAGVHDDVSALVGTTCPDVLWYDRYLYFFDQRGRPFRFPEGGEIEDLWKDLADVFAGPDTPGLGLVNVSAYEGARSNIAVYPWVDGVVFSSWNTTFSLQSVNWLYSHRTGRLFCRIIPSATGVGASPTYTGNTYDSTNGRVVLAFGQVATSVAYASVSPVVSGDFYNYQDSGGVIAPRSLYVGPFGGQSEATWRFSEVAVTAVIGATSSGRSGTATVSLPTAEIPFGSLTSEGSQTIGTSTTSQSSSRKTWSVQRRLRWCMVVIADGGGFEGWGVSQVSVMAQPEKSEPQKT